MGASASFRRCVRAQARLGGELGELGNALPTVAPLGQEIPRRQGLYSGGRTRTPCLLLRGGVLMWSCWARVPAADKGVQLHGERAARILEEHPHSRAGPKSLHPVVPGPSHDGTTAPHGADPGATVLSGERVPAQAKWGTRGEQERALRIIPDKPASPLCPRTAAPPTPAVSGRCRFPSF